MATPPFERDTSRQPESAEVPRQGLRLTFTDPEVLQAYILSPERQTTSSLAERMSGIRERVLGEFPLDGQDGLFESVKLTLIVEPDRDIRGGRPTAIIRADLQLGSKESNLSRFQAAKAGNDNADSSLLRNVSDIFGNLQPDSHGIALIEMDGNTAFIHESPLDRETIGQIPAGILQIWENDAGVGTVSLSLFSFMRFNEHYRKRIEAYGVKADAGWEVDFDEVGRWRFDEPVGIDVRNPERFKEALAFYEEAFVKAMTALYQSEGIMVPNLDMQVESPLIFIDQEGVTYSDIGAQGEAVQYLQEFAGLERNDQRIPGMKRAVLLEGPPGNGKSSLVEAFASDLGAPLIKKTSPDLLQIAGGDIVKFLESAYLEAQAAARRTNGKAVLVFEQLDALLGSNSVVHDFFLTVMDKWTQDAGVVLMATSNYPDRLHPAIVDRFADISVLPPNEKGIREILEIHAGKITKSLGQDVFTDVDFDQVAKRLATRKDLSGRAIPQFLSGVYLLSRRAQQGLETDFVLSQIPDTSFGFGRYAKQ